MSGRFSLIFGFNSTLVEVALRQIGEQIYTPGDLRVIIYGPAFRISKAMSQYFASAWQSDQQQEDGSILGTVRISLLNMVFFAFRACLHTTRTRIIVALRLQLDAIPLTGRTNV